MKVKNLILWSVFALAVVATIAGLCFFFLGNSAINEIPSVLQVQKIDGKYYLMTEFNSKYEYRFKLEQSYRGSFVTVRMVESKGNLIDLTGEGLDVSPNENYRFSSCYVSENKSGEFSKTVLWHPTSQLETVTNVEFDEQEMTLAWEEVHGADKYTVFLLDVDGKELKFDNLQENLLSLENLGVGEYEALVVAGSDDSNVADSQYSKSITIKVERKNEILQAALTQDLIVSCSLMPKEFQVFVDGKLKATFVASSGLVGEIVEDRPIGFRFQNARAFLGEEFLNNVQIKSTANGCVLESKLVDVAQ